MGNEFEPKPEAPHFRPQGEEDLSVLYTPEVTERIKSLILRLEAPAVVKEQLLANVDNYDRRDLIDMLVRYFTALKKIDGDDRRAKVELEEARKRLQDSVEADRISNPDSVW